MTGWTPLFQQIVGSSIWSAEDHVRIAWITMLACCRKDGICPVTAGGLARLANITPEKAQNALEILSAPDPDTLTQANEGRRIERADSGWKLLNWQTYREMAKKEMIKESNRIAQANWRASQQDASGTVVGQPGEVPDKAKGTWELTKIMEAKEKEAKELKLKHCSETAMGSTWNNEEARVEFQKLKREINKINKQIASK